MQKFWVWVSEGGSLHIQVDYEGKNTKLSVGEKTSFLNVIGTKNKVYWVTAFIVWLYVYK